jgi:hypothetical protein
MDRPQALIMDRAPQQVALVKQRRLVHLRYLRTERIRETLQEKKTKMWKVKVSGLKCTYFATCNRNMNTIKTPLSHSLSLSHLHLHIRPSLRGVEQKPVQVVEQMEAGEIGPFEAEGDHLPHRLPHSVHRVGRRERLDVVGDGAWGRQSGGWGGGWLEEEERSGREKRKREEDRQIG